MGKYSIIQLKLILNFHSANVPLTKNGFITRAKQRATITRSYRTQLRRESLFPFLQGPQQLPIEMFVNGHDRNEMINLGKRQRSASEMSVLKLYKNVCTVFR